MDEYFWAIALTVGTLFGAVAIFVKFANDWTVFSRMITSKTKWRDHPNAPLATGIVLVAVIFLVGIWWPVVSGGSPKQMASKSEPSKPEQIVNEQSVKMAREFEQVLATVSTKQLSAFERTWYLEYLSAVMPLKVEAVCGKEECAEYERMLTKAKAGSKDIQHQFRSLEPFVTRKRYIQPQTPLAGPVINLAMDDTKPPAVQQAISTLNEKQPAVTQAANSEAEKRPLLSPPEKLPEPADNSEIASNSSEPKKASEPRVVNNVPRNADEVSPPHIVAKPSLSSIPSSQQLDAFLTKQAFVQCRRCGQEHRMSYNYFATYDHHTCAKCGFTMSTVAFSAKLAKEKQQLMKQASR